jgi:hypothetical protein
MPPSKNRFRMKRKPSTALGELFRWYAIPPTSLHQAVQEAARQEGWTPPWNREEQQNQKKAAGQKSGFMRGGRTAIRRHFIKTAFKRLEPAYRAQPYSDHSIDALKREYRELLAGDGFDSAALMSRAPFKADRETLKKDLKALGIRSNRQKHRTG